MNFNWNKKWKSILVWLSAYLNFIAFVLVGGYLYIKKEDEEVQSATKQAFLVTLIFTAINAFLLLFSNIGGLTNTYYSSSAYKFYSVCVNLVNIAKVVVYATFIIFTLVKKDETAMVEAADPEDVE